VPDEFREPINKAIDKAAEICGGFANLAWLLDLSKRLGQKGKQKRSTSVPDEFREPINKAIDKAAEICGGVSNLAWLLDISQGAVSNWKGRGTEINGTYCVQIESLTGGSVTRKHLRPHDWRRVWPELALFPDDWAKFWPKLDLINGDRREVWEWLAKRQEAGGAA
jgi:DNA-binding transcriptional regulator YdaS (Cro superfamily)